MIDRNSMRYWLEPLIEAGLAVPPTATIETCDMSGVLDGKEPADLDALAEFIRAAGSDYGWPLFLRTGHGSGKHEWNRTCYVSDAEYVVHHVCALVEWSYTVDIFGLPTDFWAARKMLDVAPITYCRAYGGMPVVREFRLFVKDGEVEHVQPYWPPRAVELGDPDGPWRGALTRASMLGLGERGYLVEMAQRAAGAVVAAHEGDDGWWSVDMLQDAPGAWWITDMAEGARSFRWSGQP